MRREEETEQQAALFKKSDYPRVGLAIKKAFITSAIEHMNFVMQHKRPCDV
jgi:hypothetical protein